jgi:hypothetical protein
MHTMTWHCSKATEMQNQKVLSGIAQDRFDVITEFPCENGGSVISPQQGIEY